MVTVLREGRQSLSPPPRGVSSGSDDFLGLRPPAAQGTYRWSRVPWAWWAPAPRSAQAEAGCPCHPAVGPGHRGMDTEALGSELGSCSSSQRHGRLGSSPSSRSLWSGSSPSSRSLWPGSSPSSRSLWPGSSPLPGPFGRAAPLFQVPLAGQLPSSRSLWSGSSPLPGPFPDLRAPCPLLLESSGPGIAPL